MSSQDKNFFRNQQYTHIGGGYYSPDVLRQESLAHPVTDPPSPDNGGTSQAQARQTGWRESRPRGFLGGLFSLWLMLMQLYQGGKAQLCFFNHRVRQCGVSLCRLGRVFFTTLVRSGGMNLNRRFSWTRYASGSGGSFRKRPQLRVWRESLAGWRLAGVASLWPLKQAGQERGAGRWVVSPTAGIHKVGTLRGLFQPQGLARMVMFLAIFSPSALLMAQSLSLSAASQEERLLHELVNNYRAENGLPPIPLSPSLTHVAKTHVADLNSSPPSGECNLHSWSSNGTWTPCCYTSDHAQAKCMWDKPRELTDYPGNGYETAYGGSGGYQATATSSLDGWKGSAPHNAVILNQNIWADVTWQALGVGIDHGYAVLWFGEEADVLSSAADNPVETPVSPEPTSPVVWNTSKTQAFAQATQEGKQYILLVACGSREKIYGTFFTSAAAQSLIQEHFVLWFSIASSSDPEFTGDYNDYVGDLWNTPGFGFPMVIVIDPSTDNYVEGYRFGQVQNTDQEIVPKLRELVGAAPASEPVETPTTTTTNNGSTTGGVPTSSCNANSCTHSNISINRPGFYVARVKLATGANEGMWGLSVNTTSGINTGGFNAGATLTKDGVTPGFLGFYLSRLEAVNISAFEYTGDVSAMNVFVEKMDSQGSRSTVHYFNGVRQNSTSQPLVEETSRVLEPGFYIVSAASEPGSPSGSFGISVNGDSLIGGVNIGGWLDATTTGFGAFYVASPQQVNLKLLFGDNYSTVGSGALTVEIDYQDSSGERTLYWSSTSNQPPADDNSSIDIAGFLSAHNAWRQPVGVPDLIWSDQMAQLAQDWADQLKGQSCAFQHRPNNRYGENLYWASGFTPTAQEVVDSWGGEIVDYDYATNSCTPGQMCGHYTQIVWQDTQAVGCGTSTCEDGSILWVCNYDPPGNYIGQKPY